MNSRSGPGLVGRVVQINQDNVGATKQTSCFLTVPKPMLELIKKTKDWNTARQKLKPRDAAFIDTLNP